MSTDKPPGVASTKQTLTELLPTRAVAEHLGVSVATLYHWRHIGTGPDSFRLRGQLRYRREDVETYVQLLVHEERRT